MTREAAESLLKYLGKSPWSYWAGAAAMCGLHELEQVLWGGWPPGGWKQAHVNQAREFLTQVVAAFEEDAKCR